MSPYLITDAFKDVGGSFVNGSELYVQGNSMASINITVKYKHYIYFKVQQFEHFIFLHSSSTIRGSLGTILLVQGFGRVISILV